MNDVHFMSNKNDWETPQELFDKLHEEFHFTLDAAANDHNHKLPRYYTEQTDGLKQDWGGSVYSAIHPTALRKPVYGQRSVGKKRRNRTLWLCFSFLPGLIVNPFMTSSTISRVSQSAFSKAAYALRTEVSRWVPLRFRPCCVSLTRI